MSDADLLRRAEAKVRKVTRSPLATLSVADLLAQHALVHDSYDCLHDPCAAVALARRILGEES